MNRHWHPTTSFLAEKSTQICSMGWEGGSFGEMTLCFNFFVLHCILFCKPVGKKHNFPVLTMFCNYSCNYNSFFWTVSPCLILGLFSFCIISSVACSQAHPFSSIFIFFPSYGNACGQPVGDSLFSSQPLLLFFWNSSLGYKWRVSSGTWTATKDDNPHTLINTTLLVPGIWKTRCSTISEILIETTLHVVHLQACWSAAPASAHQQAIITTWLVVSGFLHVHAGSRACTLILSSQSFGGSPLHVSLWHGKSHNHRTLGVAKDLERS